jgi:hypothetical protein
MGVELNGIAHIQLTVNDAERCVPFWERFCHFLEMKTLIRGDGIVYCIGSRTGILVRAAKDAAAGGRFDQERAGLHHFWGSITSAFVPGAARTSMRSTSSCAAKRMCGSSIRRKTGASPRGTIPCCSRIPTAFASR